MLAHSRYALSFPKLPDAINALHSALAWRTEHSGLLASLPLDPWSEDAKRGQFGEVFKTMAKYVAVFGHRQRCSSRVLEGARVTLGLR
jgi:hypothetical protein